MCLLRYSHRLPWSISPNPFSQALQEKRSAGAALIDLTISNPTQVFDDYPHAEIAQAYGAIDDFTYRPEPAGSLRASRAIVSYYETRGTAIDAQQLLLTASTSEAYALLFKLLCDPGDEVLAPAPSYPLFEYLAALECVHIVPYRLHYDGHWFIDMDNLRAQISTRTRAIVIVNPNNPTGSFLKKTEAGALLSIADEHALPIICDEVFMDYALACDGGRVPTLIGTESVPIFALNGLSKCAGMPQMKLGWIALSGPDAFWQAARQRLELLAETYLSVATPVQSALGRLLRIGDGIQQCIGERIAKNLQQAHAILENSAAHCLPVEGGWSAIVRVPARFSEETWAMRLLNEYGVAVQPGYFFDMESEAYLVLSLIAEPQAFLRGIQALRRLADS
jgi:alanine-synthesizing transaminase